MSRVDDWWSEDPRRTPAEYATDLARDRFWRDERRRLIATHPDFPDVAWLLDLSEELAHGLVLILSRLSEDSRQPFAEAFFEERRSRQRQIPTEPGERLAVAANVALLVTELALEPLRSARVTDLLTGASQRDDLTATPEPAVADLQKAVARVRFDVAADDVQDPRVAASLAIAEVLIPAGEIVALQAVVAHAAWAATESWERPRLLAFALRLAETLESRD